MVNGSALTSFPGDSLGTHVATTTLNMAWFNIVNVSTLTVSSITSTGAGITFSTNVFIYGDVAIGTTTPLQKVDVAGKVRATGFCIGSNCQVGVLGIYTGATTAGPYNGGRSGYSSANTLCSTPYPGSHICTNAEILFSINLGQFASFRLTQLFGFPTGPLVIPLMLMTAWAGPVQAPPIMARFGIKKRPETAAVL